MFIFFKVNAQQRGVTQPKCREFIYISPSDNETFESPQWLISRCQTNLYSGPTSGNYSTLWSWLTNNRKYPSSMFLSLHLEFRELLMRHYLPVVSSVCLEDHGEFSRGLTKTLLVPYISRGSKVDTEPLFFSRWGGRYSSHFSPLHKNKSVVESINVTWINKLFMKYVRRFSICKRG